MPEITSVVGSNMQTLTEQYRVITQNLANANTSGYKRQIMSFANTLASVAVQGATAPATGTSSFGQISGELATDFSQGHLLHTGRNLDLALEGKGFFVVDTPEGELYTRGGVFQLNAQGQLVDFSGRTVAGESGPIVVPPTASPSTLKVARNGEISVDGKKLGKLKVVEFGTPQNLEAVGNCCFRAPEGLQQSRAVNTFVQQEYQESSNVSLVQEMVDLIKVSRLYEANAKSITTQDDRNKSLLRVAMG